MNTDSGEIRNAEMLRETFKNLRGEVLKEAREKWFAIDNEPDQNCKACEGHGFIGYFPNAKVIPCPCVFATHSAWAEATVKQRDLAKASSDKGASALRKDR